MDGESSASHDVNNYVTENIPRATPYLSIIQDIASNFDRIKTPKQQLSLLREFCIYATAQHPSLETFIPLQTLVEACSDSDNDRKIFRTALYILSEVLQNDPNREIDDARRAKMWNLLSDQFSHENPSRAYVAWRIAGLLNEEVNMKEFLAKAATDALRGYQLPAKPTKWAKKSTKKDYEEQVSFTKNHALPC